MMFVWKILMDKDYIKDILQHFRQANSKVKDSLAVVVMATAILFIDFLPNITYSKLSKAKGK